MDRPIKLTLERFKEYLMINRDCKAIASAVYHKKTTKKESYYVAVIRGKEYQISHMQHDMAKEVFERERQFALENINETLVFVRFGEDYEINYINDIGNERVVARILNPKGQLFMIDFSRKVEPNRYVTYINRCMNLSTGNYNYKGYGRLQPLFLYTLENLTNFVNETFNCNFHRAKIDNHLLIINEFVSKSPQKQ